MKRYKLKKWYPSLPKEIKVDTEVVYYPAAETYSDNPSGLESIVDLHPEEVENNPEFWEEVEEKEYEILSFKHLYGNTYTKLGSRDKFYLVPEKPYTEEQLLEQKDTSIHSIKRVSDGEIFTIGDRVRIKKLQYDGSFDITRFYFDCNGDKLLCNGERCGNGHVSITKIEKKRVVLVTDDGVDLFVGDKYYVPQKNTKLGVLEFTVEPLEYDSSIKRFSSTEKARKYMLRKTVCLSMEDVYDLCNKAWTRGDGNPTSAFDRDLEELVKSKL